MTMSITQVRLPNGLVKEINKLVDKGIYANKSDVVRDAIRKLVLERHIGIISNNGNSVEEIRKIRKRLSKEKIDLDEINKLAD